MTGPMTITITITMTMMAPLRLLQLLPVLVLMTALHVPVAVAAGTGTGTGKACHSTAKSLQEAIDSLPGQTSGTGIPELLLCPSVEIELTQPIRIHQRSVRIGCLTTGTGNLCTVKGGEPQESRLIEVIGTENPFETFTVQLSQLLLDSGASYYQTEDQHVHVPVPVPVPVSVSVNVHATIVGGAGVSVLGANLVVEDCRFENNVASSQGGALHVQDHGRPILFIVTNTVFQENLSIEDDCSSIYFQQQHPMTMAELNTERDFVPSRHLRSVIDQWDDPAKASEALDQYRPRPGAELCF
ncbi:expressed unknown protein [Seminavis robusta]|uniref:Right-handed parallel beta-helix repeat-containing protein n=1 Tax=Seminavis robusta TaxID=568900 RepID=A0A9N8DV00_9STRA|nr:expressed unknown protein [Seminavis robusta]|eukprot:Sro362_g126801.1  (299) ;mRNA; r:51107-52003